MNPKKSKLTVTEKITFKPFAEKDISGLVILLKVGGATQSITTGETVANSVATVQELTHYFLPMVTKIGEEFVLQQPQAAYRRPDLLSEARLTMVKVINAFPLASHNNLKDAIAKNVWLRLVEFARLDYTVRPSVYAQRRGAPQQCCESSSAPADGEVGKSATREPESKKAYDSITAAEFRAAAIKGLTENELLVLSHLESGSVEPEMIKFATGLSIKQVYRLLHSLRIKVYHNLETMPDPRLKLPPRPL